MMGALTIGTIATGAASLGLLGVAYSWPRSRRSDHCVDAALFLIFTTAALGMIGSIAWLVTQ